MYLPPPVPLPPPDPPPAPPPAPLHPSDGRHGSLAPAGLLEAGGRQLGAHAWRPPGTIRDGATVTSRRASENPIPRNWRILNVSGRDNRFWNVEIGEKLPQMLYPKTRIEKKASLTRLCRPNPKAILSDRGYYTRKK
ncbi:hypothetical protein PGTUg99_028359 [Puccinia graminis f. sp. tritici]|uniref:Uncharacterized protein n=1 Tax=Puccinia graminis f. sp. tritici TaxID=56615 RepID=A0A5B0SEE8_PUCGR|nr:hypothetical protein PGTUg99_028359 [Puccinia graminis f. sp. tritici]